MINGIRVGYTLDEVHGFEGKQPSLAAVLQSQTALIRRHEQNLLTLQVRDGREVGFDNIPQLCGSCHGPNLRDWEAGAHGRTSGYWNHSLGAADRLSCANCHNPHAPRIPTREPAPPPHSLHGPAGHTAPHETTP